MKIHISVFKYEFCNAKNQNLTRGKNNNVLSKNLNFTFIGNNRLPNIEIHVQT